ncbi:MAG: hypothetical protein COB76_02355 [Alphaproteobacteria bacterium]|nr:MAG: hypothetical protein COB76_02355 [Alphaproteobacteria bacterium]
MIFFKYKTLAERLHNNEVSEKQQMIYLWLNSVLWALAYTASAGYSIWGDSAPLNIFDYLTDILMLITVSTCIILPYKINSKNDGKNFISRYVCLSFPITFLTFICMVILAILTVVFEFYFFGDVIETLQTSPSTLVIIIPLFLIIIYLYTNAFKIASGQKEVK